MFPNEAWNKIQPFNNSTRPSGSEKNVTLAP